VICQSENAYIPLMTKQNFKCFNNLLIKYQRYIAFNKQKMEFIEVNKTCSN